MYMKVFIEYFLYKSVYLSFIFQFKLYHTLPTFLYQGKNATRQNRDFFKCKLQVGVHDLKTI